MRKQIFLAASVITVLCSFTAMAKRLPMETFDLLRDYAIKDDGIKMLDLTGGDLLSKVALSGKVPTDFRRSMIRTEFACEDAYIRMNSPREAIVYVRTMVEDKRVILRLTMKCDDTENFKLHAYNIQQPPSAKEYAARFFKALRFRRMEELQEYLAPELFENFKTGKMPGFAIDSETVISAERNIGSNKVAVSVTRLNLKGNIVLQKTDDQMRWQVVAIDTILTDIQPMDIVRKFSKYCAVRLHHEEVLNKEKIAAFVQTLDDTTPESEIKDAAACGAVAATFIQEMLSFPQNEDKLKSVFPDGSNIGAFINPIGIRYENVYPAAYAQEEDNGIKVTVAAVNPFDKTISLYCVKVKKDGENWKIDPTFAENKVYITVKLPKKQDTNEEIDKHSANVTEAFNGNVSDMVSAKFLDSCYMYCAAFIQDETKQAMVGNKIEVPAKLCGLYEGELIFTLEVIAGKPVLTGIRDNRCYPVTNSPINTIKKLHDQIFVKGEKSENLLVYEFANEFHEKFKPQKDQDYAEKSIQEIENNLRTAKVKVEYSIKDGESEKDVTITYTLELQKKEWRVSSETHTEKKKGQTPAADGEKASAPQEDVEEDVEEDDDDNSSSLGTTFTVKLPQSKTLQMVRIPNCKDEGFMMGSPKDEFLRRPNESLHKVYLTRNFYLGKFEVTQEQWQAVMENNPSFFKGDKRPVEMVSYEDALKFCELLNNNGHAPEGWKFTLPTEAQWEYACRAGTTTTYSYGNNAAPSKMRCGSKSTGEVGSLGYSNAFGLYDMHGNVWELCLDYHHDTFYKDGAKNPICKIKTRYNGGPVLRGGSWDSDAIYCRSANRFWTEPKDRDSRSGFRLALVPAKRTKKI